MRDLDLIKDTQTDRHDRKHYLPAYAGGKCIIDVLVDVGPESLRLRLRLRFYRR